MESQPQNPEFGNNSELSPMIKGLSCKFRKLFAIQL